MDDKCVFCGWEKCPVYKVCLNIQCNSNIPLEEDYEIISLTTPVEEMTQDDLVQIETMRIREAAQILSSVTLHEQPKKNQMKHEQGNSNACNNNS